MKKTFSILLTLALVLSFSVVAVPSSPVLGSPGNLYVDDDATANGSVITCKLVGLLGPNELYASGTPGPFQGYDVGDAVEFVSGTADTWVTTIATKHNNNRVALASMYSGGDFSDGTFNLVDLDAPSSGDPFRYIQSAVTIASSPDTINVAAGIYDETVTVRKSLNLVGAGCGVTTWRGNTITDKSLVILRDNSSPANIHVEINGFSFETENNQTIRADWSTSHAEALTLDIHDNCFAHVNTRNPGWDFALYVDGANQIARGSQGAIRVYDNSFDVVTGGVLFEQCRAVDVIGNTFDVTYEGVTFNYGGNSGTLGEQLIKGNVFTHVPVNWAFAMNNYHHSGTYTILPSEVSENVVTATGFAYAIAYGFDAPQSSTHDFTIYNNALLSGTIIVWGGYIGANVLNASGNWWGSSASPASRINTAGTVDYTPWLDSGTDTSADPGFQGDFSTLWVSADSPQTGTTGRIQEGVDMVSGSTVHVTAGTYDGQVTINKSLTLIGAGEDQTFLKESTAAAPVITVSHDDVTIQDLEITDDTELDEGIRIVSPASSGLTIDHVDFTNLGAGTGANAYGIYINNSFTNLSVTNSDFVPVTHTTYYRTMGIFAPNHLNLSDFEVLDSTFQKIWTGIYLRSAIDGLDVISNTFGQVDSWDFKACVAGVYIGDGDDNNFDIENVVVTDNIFTDYGRGVYVWHYGANEAISNFEIYENTFTDSVYSSGIRFIGGLDSNEQVSFNGINVHDNIFTQASDVGGHVGLINFRIYQELAACQIAVTDNKITLSGGPYTDPFSGILFEAYDGPFKNTVVDGNTIDGGNCGGGTGDPKSSGILIIHESSTYWPSDTLEMDIHCNNITGFKHGITIWDNVASQYGGLPTGSNVNINYNNIHGNTLNGIRSGTGETVNAENNWWGDTDGSGPYDPSGESGETTDVPPCSISVAAMMNPDGTGDKVLGLVDYCPWLGEILGPTKSVATTTGAGDASFSISHACINNLMAISPTPSGCPVYLPYGVFSFNICCIDPGQQVTVTATMPGPVPVGSVWWKYQNGSWYWLPIGSDNGDNIITITLTDGGQGDADLTANGQIIDDGGPGALSRGLIVRSTEGGRVTKPGEGNHVYENGKLVKLVATPDAGYRFVAWTGDVRRIDDVNAASTTITMDWDYVIIANFVTEEASTVETEVQYELNVSSTIGGSVANPGEGTFPYIEGTVVSLVANPDDGYKFVNWTGDGITNPDSTIVTVTMNGDHAVQANFEFEQTTTTDPTQRSSGPFACFIATAAYGTPTAEQIDVLREFRDVVLLENSVGSQFVDLYYQLSPPVADFIAGNSFLRNVVRELMIDPVVWVVEATGAIWRN